MGPNKMYFGQGEKRDYVERYFISWRISFLKCIFEAWVAAMGPMLYRPYIIEPKKRESIS